MRATASLPEKPAAPGTLGTSGAQSARSRVLVVEDDPAVRELLTRLLTGEGYRVQSVETGEQALARLTRELFDLVLLDLQLPGIDGMEVLASAPGLQTDAQFIMMTAFGSVDTAVEAMKRGAFDYVNKPFRTEELLLTLERAAHYREAQRRAAQHRTGARSGVWARIVGDSPAMQRVFELVERVAPMRATVLITGETGTGKELVARAIHEASGRIRAPFIPVNCSALPETLLESELFGHIRGSFTGATADKRGLFEDAHGGTLLLDEIATVSPAIQVKLLRVLQEKRIKRVGGTQEIPVDFRLVAATNMDLEAEVEAGRFRPDLQYRLNVFPIRVPPLRERRSDIPLLANYFRMRFCEENGIEPPEISPETMRRLSEYEWPGNVRELENFVERAMILHSGGGSISFDAVLDEHWRPPSPRAAEPARLDQAVLERWPLERVEREHILRVLESTGGHRGHAAEILGISRRTLYRKLVQYEEAGLVPAHLLAAEG